MRLRITNRHTQAVNVVVEPWADERELHVDQHLVLDLKGEGETEIVWAGKYISIFLDQTMSYELR